MIGTILLVGTAIAILFTVTGVAPRALVLAGALWAIYGFATALITGVLEPAIDFAARAFSSVGLSRVGGYSAIETMVARGQYEAAAEAYRERAQERREGAVTELRKLRQDMGRRLTAADDVRIGLALVDLHEFSLKDPGWAMTELRRLIDLYPHSRRVRQMRSILAALKTEHFGH